MDEPLRQSTIYSVLRCSYQHHLRTTDPTSQAFRHPAAVFGTTIHSLIARMHAGEWNMDLEPAFLEAFEREVSTDSHQPQERIEDLNGHWATARQNDSPTLPIWWKDELAERETYRADGVAILEGYRNKDYNRNAKILLAEASFAVKVGRQTFNGTLDQLRQHPDGSLELVDFKTSKAAPPQAYV
ncbi:MAG: PD-(D/E)XK nuclease family protein, partial [Candidatus Cloacimonetes bacterium]|nr:PD-(D/E)XK nuclease family protein [Candidatus Cloacimonadota bacterium]